MPARVDRPKATVEYFTGWDPEIEQAWRVPADDPDESKRQYTKNIECDPNAKAEEFITAIFDDGFTATISSMSVRQWRAREKARAKKLSSHLHHEGGYMLKWKRDREPLLYVVRESEPSRQICQVGGKQITPPKERRTNNDNSRSGSTCSRIWTMRSP